MEKKEQKQSATNVFLRMLEDKRAIRDCIRRGGDLDALAQCRELKFAKPLI